MASRIKLKNNIDSEFSIEHKDSLGAVSLNSEQLKDTSYTVATVADMEALDVVDGQSCIVTDLSRGGVFVFDSTKVSEDNQGTNFSGWIRQYSGAVNVKWFGAVGDGVTDDTEAIQKTIDTRENVVFSVNGDYIVTGEIEVVQAGQVITFLNTGGYGYGNELGKEWVPTIRILAKSSVAFTQRIRTDRKSVV